MEVILLERIEKLGQMGEMVNVRPGYARNFLLPQKKAISASEDSKAYFEGQRAQLEGRNLELKSEAEKLASKMDGLFVTMVRQAGDAGQLYGSVNARDIAVGATEAGFTTERRQVTLDVPIKTVGLHSVTVTLHPEVSVTVTANVARTADEAATQERTGEAVIKSDDDIGQSEPDLLAEALSEDETNNAADAVSDDVADAESGA
ncbi:MAG: 50S ribosomal protein L9, partial [Rhodospirillales bacterium]|nr:50S ribosomal protein L9 [Rhodospirillales bacterium]